MWLRMLMIGMEVPGFNPGKIFLSCILYAIVTTLLQYLLEYLDPEILYLFSFLLYNFVVVYNSIVFQTIKKHCHNDEPIYTPFSSNSRSQFTL